MSSVPSESLARLALCSRELKAKSLRREAQVVRAQVEQLNAAELASETVRAGACLAVALDKLTTAVREMNYHEAEEELQRALSFAAWSTACKDAAATRQHALAA